MQVMLKLELDPTLLVQLIAVCQAHGQRLADSTPSLPEAAGIRTLLTGYGLTPRQCDLVLLDVQGYTRADIAAHCDINPATVKKYWTAIYARLGIQRRQALRAWVLAQVHSLEAAGMQAQAVGTPHEPSNDLPVGDWSAAEPAAILNVRSTAQISDCQETPS
jgi:DNA-binding CsgD family transcriptional regulator